MSYTDPLSPTTKDTDVSEDICDAQSDEMYVLPPDGGYGWVVLVASFVCNFLVDGMGYSVGILNETFLQRYGESQAKTALVGSLQTGYGFVGPLVAALANKYTCRVVTVAGSLLTSLAFVLSAFATNVDMLICTVGLMAGIGFGMMYLPAIVIVGFYFDRRRSLATGFSVCGSSIGGFIVPPVLEHLIRRYGWKHTSLCVAGTMLLGSVAGLLFKPHKLIKQKSFMYRLSTAQSRFMRRLRELNKDQTTPTHSRSMPEITPNARTSSMGESVEPLTRVNDDVGRGRKCRSFEFVSTKPTRFSESILRDLRRPVYRKDIFYG
ncbi:Monocarboxylate transporter 14 [Lamellibrachia satsuma]|nr:Monocarboxylate transporter 14 [Lamellibrachia satsuma]